MTKTELMSVMDILDDSSYTAPEIVIEFKCKDPIGIIGASKNRIHIISDMVYVEDEMKPLMHIVSPSEIMQITVTIMKSNKIVNSVNCSIDNFFGMTDKSIIKKPEKPTTKRVTKKKAVDDTSNKDAESEK